MKIPCFIAITVLSIGLLAGCNSEASAQTAPDSFATTDPTTVAVDSTSTPSPTESPAPTLTALATDAPNATPTAEVITATTYATAASATGDHTPPAITHIAASTGTFTVSDCSITQVTVTADIADPSGVVKPTLWYRVRAQTFTPVPMQALGGDRYSVTVKGVDLPRNEYGVWEFYLTAQDTPGNAGKSPANTSVQFLPCAAR